MERIVVRNSNGERLDELVQWDRDVYVYVDNPDVGDAWDVHFFNVQSTEALVVYSTYEAGVLKAKIPNELLRVAVPVVGYIYIEKDDDGDKSVYGFRLPIKMRPKPADYIYTDSADYVSISAVLRECRAYATSAAESEDNAGTYATLSQSYAVGGTSYRTDEDTDNSKYYSEQAASSASEAARSAEIAENAVIATDAEAVFELFNDVTLDIENLQSDLNTAEGNISDLQSAVSSLQDLTSNDVTEADVDALFEE